MVMVLPAKATHQQTRAFNSALVLRVLYDAGPVSRASIARLTGLTSTTVSELVAALIADGLAQEVGRGPSTGGKAPILMELIDDSRLAIGLDLGERAFRVAVVNLRGMVRRVIEAPVDAPTGDEALALVFDLVDRLAAETRPRFLGIGVGTPGVVDAANGTIRWAVNLDWQDLPLAAILAERYGVPAYVANDSRAAALAIHLFGSDPRPANLVAIKVGRGIGAGVVLGGELFHGDGAGAGEIGHTVVDVGGHLCRCGRFGCLETVASTRAIIARVTEAAREVPDGMLGRRYSAAGRLALEDVVTALEVGDVDAHRIVVAAGRYLGQVVAGMIGTLDIERIVLHGSVAKLGGPWIDAVRDEATRRSLGLLAARTTIEVVADDDLVVRGASALLLTGELGLAVTR